MNFSKCLSKNLTIGIVFMFFSCATSMTPIQVKKSLPNLTKSKFITYSDAEEAIKKNECRYLVRGRKYVAPMGLTVKNDLKYGARGIDEWVNLDGGNSYVLISYKWVSIDSYGSTQLHIEFDTLQCQ